jgi:hypothetical protein
MYRKEECLSLLKDLERPEAGDENWDKSNKTPILKWHKVYYDLFLCLLIYCLIPITSKNSPILSPVHSLDTLGST